jgi:hypothetical protein
MQTEMVKATIAGTKTMTRRNKGFGIINEDPNRYQCHGLDDEGRALFEDLRPEITPWITPINCPYGKVGDVLWVRETFARVPFSSYRQSNDVLQMPLDSDGWEVAVFKAGWTRSSPYRWKPCIHMPKAAARIWLEITDIRVERLNDISQEDALAEGIGRYFSGLFQEERYQDYLTKKPSVMAVNSMGWHNEWRDPVTSFYSLWQSINGNWEDNPWVWVISFKVLSTTGRPTELDVKEVAHA